MTDKIESDLLDALERITTLQERVAELEKAINDAPHHMLCDATNLGSVGLTERAPCDCWKSAALKGERG